jgi:hypothetical protein
MAQSTGPIEARVSFFSKDDFYNIEKPYYFSGELTPDESHRRTNQAFEEHNIVIQDIRNGEYHPTLTENGVEVIRHIPTEDLSRITDARIAAYLREITSFMKQRMNAEHCFCYSYKVRLCSPNNVRVV